VPLPVFGAVHAKYTKQQITSGVPLVWIFCINPKQATRRDLPSLKNFVQVAASGARSPTEIAPAPQRR